MASCSSSSSFLNWTHDVFLSFRGEDVRVTFRSHFLKELDRKMITAFKDNEIEKSHSLWPELVQAIKDSRISVVIFSKNYASSSWCLNELLEIVRCNEEFGQIVIPVFYGVDPSHVRYQTDEFGSIFKETCKKNTEVQHQWNKALTYVANMLGFHSTTWNDEAKMIEEIVNDVLGKLLLTSSKDFDEDLVGIEAHIATMSLLLQLESDEVRMVGIWGSSGIGKTTIARVLFNLLSRRFQGSSIFIDRGFLCKSLEIYRRSNPDDPNMKLHLQNCFLSEILGKKDIKIDHLGALGEWLKRRKVLIVIDDLDDQMVLETLVGETQWFGSGSRIIVVTNSKHFLTAHGIDHIYEVSFPTEVQAVQMLCRSAFKQNYAPQGFGKLVTDVARHANGLPLGLNLLGKYLRVRDKEFWMNTLRRLENGLRLDGKVENILRISYDGLDSGEDQAIFRHIACLFNHMEVTIIKLLLADSNLDVDMALQNLADKSLIHVSQGHVVMHRSLQEMGKKIVRIQSIDKPGEREFLVDPNDICHVLNEGIGTQNVLGISLGTGEINELQVHENAFKGMHNLRFLEIVPKKSLKQRILHLPENFDYLSSKLKLLSWSQYPLKNMPSGFRPENLVKLKMQNSNLYKLWEGVVSLSCLTEINLAGSSSLKDIPDLSRANNLKILSLQSCTSLVELPSSIRDLNKLETLNMSDCRSLRVLPTGFNLKSLSNVDFNYCSELKTFPEFSTNISDLTMLKTNIEDFPSDLYLKNLDMLTISTEESDGIQQKRVKTLTPFLEMLSPTLTYLLWLENIPSLVEIPYSFQNLNQLKVLYILNCKNLETLPTTINLQSLDKLSFYGCSRLRSFPEISTNIKCLNLEGTWIEEVPRRIEKFSNLTDLCMKGCNNLQCVSLPISKMRHLKHVDFSNCGALSRVDLSGCSREVEMEGENIDTVSDGASSFLPKVHINFLDCFNLDLETILHQESITLKSITFSGEEVPSYFTHRTTGVSSLTIPLLHVPRYQQPFFRSRVCAVVTCVNVLTNTKVKCELRGRFGNNLDIGFSGNIPVYYVEEGIHLLIFDYRIPLNREDNAPLAQLNYDHLEIQIRTSNEYLMRIEGWGIRLLEECPLPQHVYESDEHNLVKKTEHNEQCSERLVKRNGEVGSNSRLSEGPLKKPMLCLVSDSMSQRF